MNVVTRGVRNAFRNATRTIAIIAILGISLGLSLVMLIANKTIGNQINTTLSSIGTTITIIPNGVYASEGGAHLDMREVQEVQGLAHVNRLAMAVTGRVQTVGTVSDLTGAESPPGTVYTSLKADREVPPGATVPSNFSPSFSLTGTNYPTDGKVSGNDSVRIVSGIAFDGTQDNNKAMISARMARINNLGIGSTFTAYSETFTVTGLFDTGTAKGNNRLVLASLPTVQRLTTSTGKVSVATATVDSLRNLASVTDAVKHTLQSQPVDVTSGLEQANNALQPLTSVQRVSTYSLAGAIVASAIIMLLTMVMIVRERRREIGILKAIGIGNGRVITQYMCEAVTFALLGTTVGLAIGAAASNPVTHALVSGSSTAAQTGEKGVDTIRTTLASNLAEASAHIGWDTVLYGFGAAIVIALAGSALAAFVITKVRPAEVLRSE